MQRLTRRLLWVLWLAGFALGAVGLGQRLLYGHSLAAYGSYVPWGLWVGLYFHGVGIAGGVYLLGVLFFLIWDRYPGAYRRLRVTLLLSVVSLAMGLTSIWLDLGRMERGWRILASPGFTSMMAFNAWMYLVFAAAVVVAFMLTYRPASTWLRPILLFGLPFALAFPSQSGAFFGVVDAKPYWQTALFPVLFLMSALAAGAGTLTAVEAFLGPNGSAQAHGQRLRLLRWATLIAVLAYFVLEWSEISIAYWSPTSEHRAAWDLVMAGPFWWVFWIFHVFLGGIVPLALLTWKRRSTLAVGVAGWLVAVTFISTRLNILIPGQALAQLEGLADAFRHPRLEYFYVATTHEYLVTFFLVALGTGLFYLGMRLLPGMQAPARASTPTGKVVQA